MHIPFCILYIVYSSIEKYNTTARFLFPRNKVILLLVEELAPVTYALVCALILTFDLNKVPIGVTKKVGHVIGVMVIFPPS